MIDIKKSTEKVVNNLKSVRFNKEKIKKIAQKVNGAELRTLETYPTSGSWGEDQLQYIYFIFDSLNYCFWSEKGKEKWSVRIDGSVWDGSIALFKSLVKEAKENRLFFESNYLANIDREKFGKILEGNTEIPLFDKRLECVKEVGNVLTKKYNGSLNNLLVDSNFNAVILLEKIITDFPSFNDTRLLDTKELGFYKRAQLQIKMMSDVGVSFGNKPLHNLDKLTALADYKIPQLLRALEIIEYNTDLANKVDNLDLIPKDSKDEIEIRVATIWAIEYLKEELLKKYSSVTSSQINSMLWGLSQRKGIKTRPYHRTYTTAY